MNKKTGTLAALGAGALIALSLLGASPAAAQVPDEKLREQHCFTNHNEAGAVDAEACAGSIEELEKIALDEYGLVFVGDVKDQAELDAAQARLDEQYAARGLVAPMATSSMAQFYYGASYTGSSFLETSPYSCATNPFAIAYKANLASVPGANDNVESYRVYSGCKVWTWENANKGGALFGPTNYDVPSLGSMNDRVSSWCVRSGPSC